MVVDANVLIAALMRDSTTRRLLLLGGHELHVPDVLAGRAPSGDAFGSTDGDNAITAQSQHGSEPPDSSWTLLPEWEFTATAEGIELTATWTEFRPSLRG